MPSLLARVLDRTLLRADAASAEIDRLCDEAPDHRFTAVCVNGRSAQQAARRLT